MAADHKDSAAIITGLQEAARLTDVHAHADGKLFVLKTAELRHAPALLEMFADDPRRPGSAKWTLNKPNRLILRLLSRLRGDIGLILGALTPILIEDPLYANAALLLRRYGAGLLDVSREIDGLIDSSLHQAVSAACEAMFLYADHVDKSTRTADSLRKDILQIRQRLAGLLGTVIVFCSDDHAKKEAATAVAKATAAEENLASEAGSAAAEATAADENPASEAATAAAEANAAAAPATAIDGLRHAFLLTATPIPTPGCYTINSVQVGDAPAMLHLLDKAQREQGWVVPRRTKLGHLARISNVSDILLDAVLPALLKDPTDPSAYSLLKRYAWSLAHVASKLDRPEEGVKRAEDSFAIAVGSVSKFLKRHAEHLRCSTRDLPWLRNNVDDMRDKITEVKALVVVIPPDKVSRR